MPAKSRRQQRYLYAKFGSDWVHKHHFDEISRKEMGVPKKKKPKK